MANAGRVAIVPKGDYSSSTAYKRLDLVRYNEKAYVAKKANTGVAPTNTEYWMLMTSDGITIDTALSDTSTNPVQNKVIKTAIDNIQTTSRATLSTAGWYRVAEYKAGTMAQANGGYANSCEISIKEQSYGSVKIRLDSHKNSQEFVLLSADYNIRIPKIRYTVTTDYKAYIEIYLSDATSIIYSVVEPQDYAHTWKTISAVATSETVDGVTVTTTYDIPANASPVTDLDLAQVDGTAVLTTSILAKAVELADGFHSYRLGGRSYTGSDLPATEYRYSSAEIYKRGSNSIVVVLYPNANSTAKKIQYNIYESSWLGWNELPTTADLANYLPKSGGGIDSPLTTPITINSTSATTMIVLQFLKSGISQGQLGFDGVNNPIFRTVDGDNRTLLHTGNYTDHTIAKNGGGTIDGGDNAVPLFLSRTNGDCVELGFKGTSGALGYLGFSSVDNPVFENAARNAAYSLHHDGNSAKVAIQESAPTDTSALWVDTANNKVKAYKDGAWTAMA